MNESDNAPSYIAQPVLSALIVTAGSGRALGNEHEFAAASSFASPIAILICGLQGAQPEAELQPAKPGRLPSA